jgi:regulator of replication initiation timing
MGIFSAMFGGDMEKRIFAAVTRIEEKVNFMSIELDTLIEKVTAIETVGDSAIALLADLKVKLDEAIASNDPAELQALSDRLGAQAQELADAIAANTPAA